MQKFPGRALFGAFLLIVLLHSVFSDGSSSPSPAPSSSPGPSQSTCSLGTCESSACFTGEAAITGSSCNWDGSNTVSNGVCCVTQSACSSGACTANGSCSSGYVSNNKTCNYNGSSYVANGQCCVAQSTCSSGTCQSSCSASQNIGSSCNWNGSSFVGGGLCCLPMSCTITTSSNLIGGIPVYYTITPTNFSMGSTSDVTSYSCGSGATTNSVYGCSSGSCVLGCAYPATGASNQVVSATARDQVNTSKSASCQVTENIAAQTTCSGGATCQSSCSGTQTSTGSCNWQGGSPVPSGVCCPAPTCTISPSSTSIGRGGNVTYTVNVSNRPSGVTYGTPYCSAGGTLTYNNCDSSHPDSCSFTCAYTSAGYGSTAANISGTSGSVFSCSSPSVTINSPVCSVSLSPSGQNAVQGGNATLSVSYSNFGGGAYNPTATCTYATPVLGLGCGFGFATGGCALTCQAYTSPGTSLPVNFQAQNGTTGSDYISCSTSVQVRSCSITTPNPTIVSGDNAVFTLTPHGFTGSSLSPSGVSCGEGSVISNDCSSGTYCTVTCGPYSTASNSVTFSASLVDGSGGPTVSCGSTSVAVAAKVSCPGSQKCSKNTCGNGYTPVTGSSCNQGGGNICCDSTVTCAVGTCMSSCGGSTPVNTGNTCNTQGTSYVQGGSCCVPADSCLTSGSECRQSCLANEVQVSQVTNPGTYPNAAADASCNVTTATPTNYVSGGTCCTPRSCSATASSSTVKAGDNVAITVTPANFIGSMSVNSSGSDVQCDTAAGGWTKSVSCPTGGNCAVTCNYSTTGTKNVSITAWDNSAASVACSSPVITVTASRSCAVALVSPPNGQIVGGGSANFQVTASNFTNSVYLPAVTCPGGTQVTPYCSGGTCSFTCSNLPAGSNQAVSAAASDGPGGASVACTPASITVATALQCSPGTCQNSATNPCNPSSQVQDTTQASCNALGTTYVANGVCCVPQAQCSGGAACTSSSCSASTVWNNSTCNINNGSYVSGGKCCIAQNPCSTSGAVCQQSACSGATPVPDTVQNQSGQCNYQAGTYVTSGVCCDAQNLCTYPASCSNACTGQWNDARHKTCNVGGTVCCVTLLNVSLSSAFTAVAGDSTSLTPALSATVSGGVSPYSYSWQFASGQNSAACSFNSATASSPAISCNNAGSAQFYLSAADSSGQVYITPNSAITVNPPLVANAGADVSTTVNTPVTLNGSATGGMTPYSYSWAVNSGLNGANCSFSSGTNIASPAIVCANNGTTQYTLTVTDSRNASSTSTVKANVNNSLTAYAGQGQSVIVNQSITLSGTGGGGFPPYTYTWSVPTASGCGFTSTNGPTYITAPTTSTTTSATIACSSTGTVIVSLLLQDSKSKSSTSTMALTVNPPLTLPAFPAGTGNTVIAGGYPLSLIGPQPSGGNGGNTYSWSIAPASGTSSQGASPSPSASSSTTSSGSPNCSLSPTNTQSTNISCTAAGGTGTVQVTYTVTDSTGNTASSAITVYVVQPLSVNAGGPYSGVVGSPTTISASPSGGMPFYYITWSVSNPSNASPPPCSISTASVTCTQPGSYTLTANVSDSSNPMQFATSTAGLTVNTVNLPPSVSITGPAAGTYLSGSTLHLTVNTGDPDGDTISSVDYYSDAATTNLIAHVTGNPFSYDWPNMPAGNYALVAKATDSRGATASSSPVNVTVVANTPCSTPGAVCQPNSCSGSTPVPDPAQSQCSSQAGTYVPGGTCCIPAVTCSSGTCQNTYDPVSQVQGAACNWNGSSYVRGGFCVTPRPINCNVPAQNPPTESCQSGGCPGNLQPNGKWCGSLSQTCCPSANACLPGAVCEAGPTCNATAEYQDTAKPTCNISGGTICCRPLSDIAWINLTTTGGKTVFTKTKSSGDAIPLTITASKPPQGSAASVVFSITRSNPDGTQIQLSSSSTAAFPACSDASQSCNVQVAYNDPTYTNPTTSLAQGNYKYTVTVLHLYDASGNDIIGQDSVTSDNSSSVFVTVVDASAGNAQVPETSFIFVAFAALFVLFLARQKGGKR